MQGSTNIGGVFVNDFDSFAVREIFTGNFDCHMFCLIRNVKSSSLSASSLTFYISVDDVFDVICLRMIWER